MSEDNTTSEEKIQTSESGKTEEYRVLARKYRPQSFEDLVGQEALVRTLTNAITTGRIAHAFMLTGVRGVGKTTTARLIARALNYTGPDGQSGPTTGSTDDCETARAITEDRHPDVIEMDAASRTSVEGIREILDGVRYAPTSARYKIYIIDEVHMLSKSAFNALLKTLEEPPAHVKFILATTEIRKVPVTVLSRCQRFDLRRIDVDKLEGLFKKICEKENVTCEDEAITLIAQAADGSARDGLSLLDQAIARGNDNITAEGVSHMLGLSDRVRILDLFEAAMGGDSEKVFDIIEDLHKLGSDPQATLQDLMEMAHNMSVLKALGRKASEGSDQVLSLSLPHAAQERARECAAGLSMPVLDRAWNILGKGMQDLYRAVNPRSSLEMTLIRLIYVSELPDPSKLMKKLKTIATAPQQGGAVPAHAPSSPAAPSGQVTHPMMETGGPADHSINAPIASLDPSPMGRDEPMASAVTSPQMGHAAAVVELPRVEYVVQPDEELTNLTQIVALCEANGEMVLASNVYNYMHLVSLKKGRIEFRPAEQAPSDMVQKLTQCLVKWRKERWMVTVAKSGGEPTLAEIDAQAKRDIEEEVRAHPSIKKVFALFPEAKIERIYNDDE